MTYNVKLDLVFNTLDPEALRQSIKDAYFERRGVTTLIDRINRFSVVVFDSVKKEWRDRDEVIDTTKRSTMLPFPIGKFFHLLAQKGCRGKEYTAIFNTKVGHLVDAYLLTMIPKSKQEEIAKLESELIALDQKQIKALGAVEESSKKIVDEKLEALKKQQQEKSNQVKELKCAMSKLKKLQKEMGETEDSLSNLWGLLGKGYEGKQLELIPIVKQLDIYTNELKNIEDVLSTRVVAQARLQNLKADAAKLNLAVQTHETKNRLTFEEKETLALRNLSEITKQMHEIKKQLASLRK